MWSGIIVLLICAVYPATAKVVDLSYKGLTKEEFFTEVQTDLDVHSITVLILKGNKFDSFLDCSTHLDHMKTLDLSENQLQRFFFLCKEEGYTLEYLNVSHNHLEYIDDQALNDRIPKLKVLDLSFNQLTVVNETMLEYLKILEFLSVASNPIIEIHEKAFINQKGMIHLDLSNVSQTSFPSTLFDGMTNLSYLNISNNPIETLPFLPISLVELDISRTHILYPDDLILPHLVRFHMNFMPNITEVVLNDFGNLSSLETLSMEGCPILSEFRIWPPNSRILPRLRRLSVRGCALETLTDDLRPIMQRILDVDLRNNSWNCDCRMQWVNRLNFSNELSSEIRCKSPDHHRGKVLANIPNHELVCVEISTVAYSAIWASILIIIFVLMVAGIWLLWKSPLRQWQFPKRGSDTVSYKNVVESSNDMIRILVTDERADE